MTLTIVPKRINVALTTRRVLENGAEIFRLVGLDDVVGLQRLFKMGLGSPNDSYETGQTALEVCKDLRVS